jgi:hypothetical protein
LQRRDIVFVDDRFEGVTDESPLAAQGHPRLFRRVSILDQGGDNFPTLGDRDGLPGAMHFIQQGKTGCLELGRRDSFHND